MENEIKKILEEEKGLGNKQLTKSKKIHTGAYSEKTNTLFIFDTRKGRENALNKPSNAGVIALTAKEFSEIDSKGEAEIKFLPF